MSFYTGGRSVSRKTFFEVLSTAEGPQFKAKAKGFSIWTALGREMTFLVLSLNENAKINSEKF